MWSVNTVNFMWSGNSVKIELSNNITSNISALFKFVVNLYGRVSYFTTVWPYMCLQESRGIRLSLTPYYIYRVVVHTDCEGLLLRPM